MSILGRINPLVAGLLAAVVLVALAIVFWPTGGSKTVTADFPRTVSLYAGSDVRILGVPVGKIDSVVPEGTKVRVKFHYDDKYKVPANAKAVVISPSIVGDRFIQLTPAYKGGAVMATDAHLGVDRTATPLELDEIFSSLNDLNIALGPDGANKADASTGVGPLTRLLDSTARNFGGQGVQFNHTLKNVGDLTQTLADNKDALFGSLSKVEQFTNTLAKNDGTVRKFNDSLASGANLLADERGDLAAVLKNLSVALTEVRSFVAQNRSALTSNITGLNQISKTLVKRRDALDKILQTAPTALNNLYLAGNSPAGTLDTRDNINELFTELSTNPANVLCGIVDQGDPTQKGCQLIQQALKAPKLPRPTPFAGDPSTAPRVVEPTDPTMAGLLGGGSR